AEVVGGCLLVRRAVDADAGGLKSLASAIASRPGFVVVLLSTSTPPLVVVARSADVDRSAQQVLAGLMAKFGGRGGGRAAVGQGGGLNGPAGETLAEARRLLA